MVDRYILLFDPQEPDIGVVRNIPEGDNGHQPDKKMQAATGCLYERYLCG